MSTTTPSTSDPLTQSLDSLVRQGTLTPNQATELYNAAESRPSGGPPLEPPPPSAGWPFFDRLRAGATAFGGALGFAALLLASVLSDGEFKGSTFGVMAAITVTLGVGAATWRVSLAAVPHSRWTASVLGAFAIKGLGFTILAPWGDKDAVTYLVALGMMALGIAGFWFMRGTAFTFAAFVGGFILANQVWDNITSESDGPLMYGIIMMFFGLLVAGAGWRFESRNLTGLLGGAVALYGFVVVVYLGSLAAAFVGGINRLGSDVDGSNTLNASGLGDFDNDFRAVLILTLVLCAVLTALYAYTHHIGYLILAVVGTTQIPTIAIAILAREHPLRWGTILLGGLGALLVLAALVDQARRSGFTLPSRPGGSPGPSAPPASPPGPPRGPGGPPADGTPPAPPST